MNLTMNRIDAGKMQRVAIKVVCAVLGFGTAMSALALRLQVAVPQTETAPVNAQQQAPAQKPAFVLGVPKPGTGQPAQSFKIEVKPEDMVASSPGTAPVPVRLAMETPNSNITAAQNDTDSKHVSAGVMAGNILTKVAPVYPKEAKEQKIQGAVVLDAVIGKDGAIKSLKLLSGPDLLAQSAWDAVKQWVYKPYLLNGNPVEVETTITVNYQLAQ